MYAMSWERNANEYKYESIQTPYSVEFEEYEIDKDLSLDEIMENELEFDEFEELL